MGQVPHGSATTTEAVRRAIQHSQASLRGLTRRCGVNPKTIAKRRKRTSVADLPTGPRVARSATLSAEQETIIVAFRRRTPCCHSMTTSMRSRPPCRSSRAQRCIAAYSATASLACPRSMATSQPRNPSSLTPSAISTSTSPRRKQPKASSTSSWPSTEPASSLSSSWSRAPPASQPQPSSKPSPPQFPTASTPCSPRTVPNCVYRRATATGPQPAT